MSGSNGAGFSVNAKPSATEVGIDFNIGRVSSPTSFAQGGVGGIRIISVRKANGNDDFSITTAGGVYNSGFTSTTTTSGLKFTNANGVVNFQVGKADGSHLKFSSADNLMYISSSNFFLGNSSTNFISGSGGNIEISSSNFHLSSSGDVIMSGKVTADSGKIGGNTLTSGSIFSGTGTFGNANTPFFLDSGGRFSLKNKLSFNGSTLSVNGEITSTSGNIGGWAISNGELSSENDGIFLDGENERIYVVDSTFGNTGIQLLYNSGNPQFFAGKSNGGFIKFDSSNASSQLQISSSGFILGQSGSGATTGAFISGSKEGKLEISSSNFHMKSTGDVNMSGTVTANAGAIGGFTIANNQLTGSGTALIATNTGTDRIEIRSADNTLVFLEGTKNLASPIFFLGKTAGDPSGLGTGTTSNINRYGSRASGSTGAIANQNNLGQFRVQNPDIMAGTGMSAVGLPGRFYYQYSNVWSTLDMGTSAGSISGLKGRASIWGETRQKSPTAGSQNTSGLLVGVGGAHHDNNLSYRWNLSTGLLGVSSPHYANFTSANLPTGSGVPLTAAYSEGSYGLVSLGDVYSTGSFVLRDGPLVVSASTDGEFGGGESGVIIDSSNTSGTSAGLRLVSDSSNTTEITSNGAGVQINKGAINTTGDATFSGSYFSSTGAANKFDGGVVLTSFARNGTTKVTINHASGNITAGGNLDVGGVYTNDTQPSFLAYANATVTNLAINTNTTLAFNTEVFDVGNCFTGNNTFTAPTTGKYVLGCNIRLESLDSDATRYYSFIITSNRNYLIDIIDPNFTADLNHYNMGSTVVADMAAGDTASVLIYQEDGTAQTDIYGTGSPQTRFFGYLLG